MHTRGDSAQRRCGNQAREAQAPIVTGSRMRCRLCKKANEDYVNSISSARQDVVQISKATRKPQKIAIILRRSQTYEITPEPHARLGHIYNARRNSFCRRRRQWLKSCIMQRVTPTSCRGVKHACHANPSPSPFHLLCSPHPYPLLPSTLPPPPLHHTPPLTSSTQPAPMLLLALIIPPPFPLPPPDRCPAASQYHH